MEDKGFVTIMPGLAALFILSSFNSIFFLSLRAYNMLSVLLLLLVMSHVAMLFLERIAPPRACMLALLVFLFLAGVNIKDRPKFFIFLCTAYLVYLVFFLRGGSCARGPANRRLAIIAAASAIVSLLCFVLLLIHRAGTVTLIAASVALLGGQIAAIVMLPGNAPEAAPPGGRRAHEKK